MIVIGVDPSGEFEKGKGTTGLAAVELKNGKASLLSHAFVSATDYATRFDYWKQVAATVSQLCDIYETRDIVIEDYVLYASAAKAQINSGMETSKMIGYLLVELACVKDHKVFLNMAANVMNRWTNKILEHEGIIEMHGNRAYDKVNNHINPHAIDAVRHATHGVFFLVKKNKFET